MVWLDDLEARSNLTRSQFLIWLGQRFDPRVPLYNMVFEFALDGDLDRDRFEHAFVATLAECAALRTVFEEHDGVPLQRVLDEIDAPLAFVDLSDCDDPGAAARDWVALHARARLPLQQRAFESAVLKLGAREHRWFFNQHHLITDAWSTALLSARVAAHYDGDPQNGALPAFVDYVAQERSQRDSPAHARARSFWDRQLARPVRATRFYSSADGRGVSRTRRVREDLGAERSASLAALACSDRLRLLSDEMSRFRLFATAVFAFLARLNGAGEFAIGVPLHNRGTAVARTTPGLFIEVLPLIVDVAADDTFATLADKVGGVLLDLLGHARPGMASADLNRKYDVLLNFVTVAMTAPRGLDMRTSWVHAGAGDAAHKLRLQVHDFDRSGALTLDFDFNAGVFDAASEALARAHFFAVMDALLADPDGRVAAAPIYLPGEIERNVIAFNDSAQQFEPTVTVVDMFAAQVAATPDATAVREAQRALTYAELDRASGALAARLAELGLGRGAAVALHAPPSIEAVVAVLAVARTGGAYVPLDPRHPAGRQRSVLRTLHDSSLPLVAVVTHASSPPPAADGVPTVAIDLDALRSATAARRPESKPQAQDLAYIIFTSGSTGQPKGVRITHGALANYVQWARGMYCAAGATDFALHSSLAVDMTVTSLFVPLACGGTSVAYPASSERDLPILKVFEDDAVDVVKLTPSHLALVREFGVTSRRIGQLILGGEAFASGLARAVLPLLRADVVLYNEYGPTEATVGCMIHRFDPAQDLRANVPIGRPIANARVYLLDADGAPTPAGLEGEICIAGAGVADGYFELPQQTAARFVRVAVNDEGNVYRSGDLGRFEADGELTYLGRRDDQIKVRGARVELGEIEAALAAHPAVQVASVKAIGNADDAAVEHCGECGMPSNYPGIVFDDHLCSACRNFARHADAAQRYFRTMDDLRDVADEMRARRREEVAYDCIVLLSGGKDSTYMVHQVAALGLNVLALTLDNGFIAEGALQNARRSVTELGIDHEFLRTPHMNEIFADSLARHSNVCHGCFKTIYTLSMQRARELGVRYIMTGLSRGQIFETRLNDLFNERVFDVDSIERSIDAARKVYHRVGDAVARRVAGPLFEDDAIFDEVRFVDFYRYCDVPLDEVYRFLSERAPWVRPSDTGRSTNCLINDAGIYVHKRERGYHNYALPYSWDVRLGHKTRGAALEELDDRIDVRRVRQILDEIGYAEPPARDEVQLAAYYTSAEPIPSADLKAWLGERLTDEMLPAHFVRVDEMPLAASGKVDRGRLPMPGEHHVASAQFVAPASDLERGVAELWGELLGVERVGARDDFFDLGGTSLKAIQAIARLSAAYTIDLGMQSFFARPTVAGVAEAIEEALVAQIAGMSDDEVARLLDTDGQA